MSHIYRAKVKVPEEVSTEVMKKILELYLKSKNMVYHFGGIIIDYYGNERRLGEEWIVVEKDLWDKCKNFAINWKTGEIIGDFYGMGLYYNELVKEIQEVLNDEKMIITAEATLSVQEVWGGEEVEVHKGKEGILVMLEV